MLIIDSLLKSSRTRVGAKCEEGQRFYEERDCPPPKSAPLHGINLALPIQQQL